MKTMKTMKKIAFALLVVFATSTLSAQTKNISTDKSKIIWTGKKVTGKHEGTVNLKEGSLTFNGNKLTAGTFVVDMNSINVTDLKSGDGKEKLEKHLKSDDFFGSEKFSTSTLVFKTIKSAGKNKYTVTADLTIKEKTNPVTFDLVINGNSATTKLIVNRAKYDVKYGSGSFFDNLGDKTIYDDFDLDVTLQF